MATKISPFKANYSQDPRKGKYEAVGRFIEKMRKIQEEVKVALAKVQEEMRKFADQKQKKEKEY